MTLNGAVCSLILIDAVRRNQNGSHHCQRTVSGGNHIGHHIAIVVLASPDITAVRTDDTGNCVVDQGVEVLDAYCLELFLVFVVVDLLENILEGVVILLGNGILGCEPNVLMQIQTVVEACTGEACDGVVLVVQTLNDTIGILEVEDQLSGLLALCVGDNQLSLGALLYLHLGVLVHIAVSVTGNGDRCSPGRDIRLNALDQNRGTENRAVQNGTNGAVGALPHLGQIVLRHSCSVRGDGCALDCNAVLLGGVGAVDGYLILGLFPVFQTQIIVLGLEVNIRGQQNVLDPLPQDTGHLVAVHLDQRRCHLNLCHLIFLLKLLLIAFITFSPEQCEIRRVLPTQKFCHIPQLSPKINCKSSLSMSTPFLQALIFSHGTVPMQTSRRPEALPRPEPDAASRTAPPPAFAGTAKTVGTDTTAQREVPLRLPKKQLRIPELFSVSFSAGASARIFA